MGQSSFSIHSYSSNLISGLISVVMPVYNTPKELFYCAVSSILKQSYTNIELIIVDDGSKIIYSEIYDEFSKDDRLKVIHIENSGVSTARNIGITVSVGEFILFIDSDDTMSEDALKIMIQQIFDNDFVAIGCRHVKNINNCKDYLKGKVELNSIDCIKHLCYMDPPFSHIETNSIWGKLYRKASIGNIRFDVGMIMAEDFKFNYDFMIKNKKGVYLDYIGYNYYEHDISLSRIYNSKMLRTVPIMKKMIENSLNLSTFDALKSRCVNIAFTILMLIPKELNDDCLQIEHFITDYRWNVIKNPCTKIKVKLACLLSFLGYSFTKNVFLFIKKLVFVINLFRFLNKKKEERGMRT